MSDAPSRAASRAAHRVPILGLFTAAIARQGPGVDGELRGLIAICRGPSTAGAASLCWVEHCEQTLARSEFIYRVELRRVGRGLSTAELAQLAAAASVTCHDGVARLRRAPTREAPR